MEKLSKLEKVLLGKMSTASYPPATSSKRFVRDLSCSLDPQLSDKGRRFMAFIAHRFRRQYHLTEAELAWIDKWKEDRTMAWHVPVSRALDTPCDNSSQADEAHAKIPQAILQF